MMKKAFLVAVLLLDAWLAWWVALGQRADYMKQAAEGMEKKSAAIRDWEKTMTEDAKVNSLLWQLALQTLDGPKQSADIVKNVKSWQKANLPEETVGGFVQNVSKKGPDGKKITQWKVAWKKNSIVLVFDDKGMLSDVDVNSLLGRSDMAEPVVDEAEEES